MCCGCGIADRSRPRGSAPAATSPSVTILVAAIGDSAFTATPAGSTGPSCQVRAATARLALP